MDHLQSDQQLHPTEESFVAVPPKHSGLGIASFIIACAALLFIIISVISMISVGVSTLESISTGEITEEEALQAAPMLIVVSLLFVFSILAAFVGGILGVIGLFQRNRKKLFSILGTIVNWLLVLLVLFMMVIGMVIGASV